MKAIILLHKRADISTEEFNRHWRDVHRGLLLQMPALRGLVLNFVQPVAGGTALADGVVEAWWDSLEAMQASFGSPEGQAASADAPNLCDTTQTQMVLVDDDVAISPM